MGCGSSVSQVADISREGAFRPFRLLQSNQLEQGGVQGKVFLFGETRTERKILECNIRSNLIKKILKRTRIPFPKIHLDPIESLYEQSQQIFHQGIYGFTQQPPFNNMLTLFLQSNLIFTCGGRDYDNYNIKNQTFFYSIVEEPFKLSSEMIHSSEISQRQRFQPKYGKNKFEKMASMHKKRYCHTGLYCSKLKSILVFGGINEKEQIMSSCEIYNLFQNSWRQIAPLIKPRANAHCFQYGNRIFVFGGRSSPYKLSKKIEILQLDTLQWVVKDFKLHRGIQGALVFSPNPNQILIVGGKTHQGCNRSVLRVDLKRQTYIWDSQLSTQYRSIKGVTIGCEILVFGGQKDICQVYSNKRWRKSVFEHKQHIDLQQLQRFSFTKESLNVKTADSQQDDLNTPQQQVFFGNDIYPCLVFYDPTTGKLRKGPVPLNIRLKSYMGVVEYQRGMYMLIGGSDKSQHKCSRSCFFYNQSKNTGSLALKMTQKRSDFGCISDGSFVYVFGGYDGSTGSALRSCERYNFKLDKWQEIKSMRKARTNSRVQMIGIDKIAIVGGLSEYLLGQLEIYYLKNDEYQSFKSHFQIAGQVLVTYAKSQQDCIYVLAKGEQNQYSEYIIDLKAQDKEQEPKQLVPLVEKMKLKDATIEGPIINQIEVKSKINNGQENQQSEQSREIHRLAIPASSLEIKMIEVKAKKRYIDENNSVVEEEQYEEQFSMEKVNFQQDIVEEIRKSGKYLIEQLIKQKEGKMVEEQQIRQENLVEQLIIEGTSLNEKRQKYRNQTVDIQFKSESRGESQSIESPKVTDRQLQWLQGKYNIIKRNNICYCFNQNSLLRFQTDNDQHEQQPLANAHELKLDSLS